MEILIDHGSSRNIGDQAMLFNIYNYLSHNVDCKISIVDKKNLSVLRNMPHWRIENHKIQPIICKQVCTCLFWLILIIRAMQIAIDNIFYSKYQKHIFHNKNIGIWSELLSNMDAYWSAGGGYINDMWIETEAFWKMAFAWIFKIQNKPVIFSGQGIGPIERLSSKLITRLILNSADLISVREKTSWRILMKFHISRNNILLIGDDALTFELKEDIVIDLPEKFIALNLRFSEYAGKSEYILDRYSLLVEYIANNYTDYKFIFIPIALNKGDSDIESAKKIIARLKQYQQRISIFENISLKNVKYILSQASYAIGSSYHFCLFALSMGIPTIGLYTNAYYKQKLKGLAEMFGTSGIAIDLNDDLTDVLLKTESKMKSFNTASVLKNTKEMENSWHNFMVLSMDKIKGRKNNMNIHSNKIIHQTKEMVIPRDNIQQAEALIPRK